MYDRERTHALIDEAQKLAAALKVETQEIGKVKLFSVGVCLRWLLVPEGFGSRGGLPPAAPRCRGVRLPDGVCLRRLLAGEADLQDGPRLGNGAGLARGGPVCHPVDLPPGYHTGPRGPHPFDPPVLDVALGRWGTLGMGPLDPA